MCPEEMGDPFELQRFVDAQESQFDAALEELRSGRKSGHWMWFIFPQMAGLGRSPMAQRYAIRSLDEARAYLAHPLLGARLRQCVGALLAGERESDPEAIFGPVDAVKLRSSLTLFHEASGESRFEMALRRFFPEGPDPVTKRLLGAEGKI